MSAYAVKGFTDRYVEYASEFTDAPEVIHHRIGLMILSTVINRNVWLRQGYKNIYPNLWMVIVAPSSFYRKSYSVGSAENMLRQYDSRLILPREFSVEALIQTLSEQPQGLLMSYEFKTFVGMMSREYMAGAQSLITELYDCPEIYDRKLMSRSVSIKEPFLNILSASTVDWLRNSLKEDDLAGGFLPRFLIVTAPEKTKVFPFQPVADYGKKNLLVDLLRSISEVTGEVKFADDAKDFYIEWYTKFEKEHKGGGVLSPFYARLTEYAKKFCIILAIDRRMGLEIKLDDCRDACILAETFARDITRYVEDGLVYDRMGAWRKKVETALKGAGAGGISKRDLLRETRIIARNLDTILDTLDQEERVKKQLITTEESDKPVQVYFWLN